ELLVNTPAVGYSSRNDSVALDVSVPAPVPTRTRTRSPGVNGAGVRRSSRCSNRGRRAGGCWRGRLRNPVDAKNLSNMMSPPDRSGRVFNPGLHTASGPNLLWTD